jgi:dGTPase
MKNTFYNAFDLESIDHVRREDYRTPFQKDRDRIIHSSALRRLQSKTQVFLSGEYDFYRTRLTHSLEVAQIGRSLCNYLNATSPHLSDDYSIDSDLVEGICLAHDIGHPPFGHAGEHTLNTLMHPYGGFEGNAQTLRLVTKTIYSAEGKREGINATRAFIDGVMKYKTLYSAYPEPYPERHFIYDDQASILAFILGNAYPQFADVAYVNRFRSIECQIMNWADDAAYSLHDIADGIHAGFMNIEKLEQWCKQTGIEGIQCEWADAIIEAIRAKTINRFIADKVGSFIIGCTLETRETIMSNLTSRYLYRLVINSSIEAEAEFYKRIARDLVFQNTRIHQLQCKAETMLERLFDVLHDNYVLPKKSRKHLIPKEAEASILAETDETRCARLVCDYIAGMTDGFAIRTYRRLFDPSFGSIVDLV